MAQTSWDWTRWSTEHPLKRAFNCAAEDVVEAKRAGIGVLPPGIRKPDLDFLAANQKRLVNALEGRKFDARVAQVLGLDSNLKNSNFKKLCLEIMETKPEEADANWKTRGYLVTQFLAMTAGLWLNPSRAMLYSAIQAASHLTFKTCRGQSENETTVTFTSQLRSLLGDRFIATLNREKIHLPPGSFLEFGTASMQGWKDRLGSDFALVVGTIVEDIPVYRVAVFQAKWERIRGSANVSQGDGSQLHELLTSGMGYYVFYPRAFDDKAFIASVRSAESVNSDVHPPSGRPKFDVDVCCSQNRYDLAWDFATFVTVAMTSPEDSVGRVFKDIDAVADALSKDRKKPLASHILFADLSGHLKVRQLSEKLREIGYNKDLSVFEALSSLDDTPEIGDESSPDDLVRRRLRPRS